VFLSAVSATGSVSIINTASASIDDSRGNDGGEESFKVLLSLSGLTVNYGEELKISIE
jgi:hypothetical protein